MPPISRFALAVPALLALAACPNAPARNADAPPSAAPAAPRPALPATEIGALCSYDERKDPIVVGHKDNTGASFMGDIRGKDRDAFRNRWLGPDVKRVATAVARPRVDIYKISVDDDCYDQQKRIYYSCKKVEETPVGTFRGFARAISKEDAAALAVQLCERKVEQAIKDKTLIELATVDKRCRVIDEAYCPLPEAPPGPPAPAKK